jgi:hypothetical protein
MPIATRDEGGRIHFTEVSSDEMKPIENATKKPICLTGDEIAQLAQDIEINPSNGSFELLVRFLNTHQAPVGYRNRDGEEEADFVRQPKKTARDEDFERLSSFLVRSGLGRKLVAQPKVLNVVGEYLAKGGQIMEAIESLAHKDLDKVAEKERDFVTNIQKERAAGRNRGLEYFLVKLSLSPENLADRLKAENRLNDSVPGK